MSTYTSSVQHKVIGTICTGDIVMEHQGYCFETTPTKMDYVKYQCLVCRYRVDLTGWTEATIGQPGTISSSLALLRLLDVLHTSECHWVLLDDGDWEARKEAHLQAICDGKVVGHKKHKDAGVSNILKGKRADMIRHGVEESDKESDEGDGNSTD